MTFFLTVVNDRQFFIVINPGELKRFQFIEFLLYIAHENISIEKYVSRETEKKKKKMFDSC